MKKQVERTFCDFDACREGMGIEGDVKCCLCRRDICYQHRISFSQSPSYMGGQTERPKPYHLAFCVDCFRNRLTVGGLVEMDVLVPSVIRR